MHIKTMNELRALPLLHEADAGTRQAILDEYLDWLENPASQTRQTGHELFGLNGECCVLGGLGTILEARGYAVIQRRDLITTSRVHGGAVHVYGSPTRIDYEVMHALGLGTHQKRITDLNDTEGQSFAQIGSHLRAVKPVVPA